MSTEHSDEEDSLITLAAFLAHDDEEKQDMLSEIKEQLTLPLEPAKADDPVRDDSSDRMPLSLLMSTEPQDDYVSLPVPADPVVSSEVDEVELGIDPLAYPVFNLTPLEIPNAMQVFVVKKGSVKTKVVKQSFNFIYGPNNTKHDT